MRSVAAATLGALALAASALAEPQREQAYQGWRYGPISGTATLTTTAPLLRCTGNDRNERRVVRGTYNASFTGTSMRATRAAPDIEYNLAAGGPAGNTEPIRMRIRQSSQETVHVRTIIINDLGEEVCTLIEETCDKTETRDYRRASNRLNIRMRPGGRVRIYPPDSIAYGSCARGVAPAELLIPEASARVFQVAVFNRASATLRFAFSRRVGGQTATGAPVTGTIAYRASIGIRRLPGTPRARCRVC